MTASVHLRRWLYAPALLLLSLLPALCALPQTARAGEPAIIAPDNPHLHFIGRFTDDKSFGWSASAIRFKFNGTAVTALFTVTKGKEAGILAVVDGKPAEAKLILKSGQMEYPIADQLPPGEHTVELVKTSEGYIGEVMFNGLKFPAPGKLLPPGPDRERRILVIGDSITCGYGNEAPDVGGGNNVNNENAYLSYPLVAARALNADAVTICWSGKGLFRDRSLKDDQTTTLPKLFDRALPMSPKPDYDHTKFIPHVIAINLGTNDMNEEKGKKPALRKGDYQTACRDFIKRLRELYPDAKIILSIGPMELKNLVGWQAEVAKELTDVHTLVYPRKDGKEYLGGHWHPSVKMDEEMGQQLAAKIREITGWK